VTGLTRSALKPRNCREEPGGDPAAIKEHSIMTNRRFVLGLLVSTATFAVAGASFAKGPHRHHNGHDLLGAKLKKNGKYEIGKVGKEAVIAEVTNEKVTAMTAGGNSVTKVKTKTKMALSGSGNIHLAASGDIQLAQVDEWYYGYCIDWVDYVDCYWFPASDVIVTDGWVVYVPV
jgi:hypothetical protein